MNKKIFNYIVRENFNEISEIYSFDDCLIKLLELLIDKFKENNNLLTNNGLPRLQVNDNNENKKNINELFNLILSKFIFDKKAIKLIKSIKNNSNYGEWVFKKEKSKEEIIIILSNDKNYIKTNLFSKAKFLGRRYYEAYFEGENKEEDKNINLNMTIYKVIRDKKTYVPYLVYSHILNKAEYYFKHDCILDFGLMSGIMLKYYPFGIIPVINYFKRKINDRKLKRVNLGKIKFDDNGNYKIKGISKCITWDVTKYLLIILIEYLNRYKEVSPVLCNWAEDDYEIRKCILNEEELSKELLQRETFNKIINLLNESLKNYLASTNTKDDKKSREFFKKFSKNFSEALDVLKIISEDLTW